jgi:hypothetical protein
VNGSLDLPRLAAVARGFPAPIELLRSNVFPNHALKNFSAIAVDAGAEESSGRS